MEEQGASARFLWNVLRKTFILFAYANLLFALLDPLPWLGRLSGYNVLWPGRTRLPFAYASYPERSLSVATYQLEAMFASHLVAIRKPTDEFRVLLYGDSLVWGNDLLPADTLAATLNAASYTTRDGRRLVFYNLGYSGVSATKDLLLMSHGAQYAPDLILWFICPHALLPELQLSQALVEYNAPKVRQLIDVYGLPLDPDMLPDPAPFWRRTLFDQRTELAQLLQLQLYGLDWAATGFDHDFNRPYPPLRNDFEADDLLFFGRMPTATLAAEFRFEFIEAVIAAHPSTPVLLINEPIFRAFGRNSEVRYNEFYPRWAYDQFRELLLAHAVQNHWAYFDYWDAIQPQLFANTPLHLKPQGVQQLADFVGQVILDRDLLSPNPAIPSRLPPRPLV